MDSFDEEIEAFGERKTLLDWSRDRRSAVSHVTLTTRVAAGWPLEKALTFPAIMNMRLLEKVLTAFGETKTLLEWAGDPRAKVPSRTILWRVRRGWSPEDAVSVEAPKTPPPPVRGARQRPEQFQAFGTSNTLRGWLDDPRCEVKRAKLLRNLSQGMSMENALSAGGEDGRRKRAKDTLEKRVQTIEEALAILAKGAELWHARTPGGLRSSLIRGLTRHEVPPEIFEELLRCRHVHLIFETPTIEEYRISPAGRLAASH